MQPKPYNVGANTAFQILFFMKVYKYKNDDDDDGDGGGGGDMKRESLSLKSIL